MAKPNTQAGQQATAPNTNVPKTHNSSWLANMRAIRYGIGDYAIRLIAWPYFMMYVRETRTPLFKISTASDEQEISDLLHAWFATKQKEAQYAQIAAAVIFASIIQSFSWSGINNAYWLVPASWYLSILFALFAVVLGAQQTVLVGDRNLEHYQGPLQKLCPPDGVMHGRRPSLTLMLAWQGPLMFLSYSLVWYIIGLSTYIIYPVIQEKAWNEDAKILLVYGIGVTTIFSLFIFFSRGIHYTLS